jgi:hypothetical protein
MKLRDFACLGLMMLVGCSDEASVARSIGHARLKADAPAMMKTWHATGAGGRSIPPAYWPDSIRQLHPVDVYPHMLGVLVVTSKSQRYHWGIYIVTEDNREEELEPSSGSGLGYEFIAPGLHKAEVKIRRSAARATTPPQPSKATP